MIDVVVRLIAAWLNHPEHGINALAARLPRTNLAGPDDDAPPSVTIVNDADDKRLAEDILLVEAVPAVCVWGDSHTDRPLKGYAAAKDVVIGIGFVVDEDADPVTANRDCGMILRAAVVSLARFNDQRFGAVRDLNGVLTIQVSAVEEQRITAVKGNRKCLGFLLPHVAAIDSYTNTILGAPQL